MGPMKMLQPPLVSDRRAPINRFLAITVIILLVVAVMMAAFAVVEEFSGPVGPGEIVEQSIVRYRLLLAEDAENVAARLEIARAYVRAGRPEQAAREFKIVLESDPKEVASLTGLARLYEDGGSASQARAYYLRATKVAPADELSWLGLSRLALAKEDFEAAAGHLRQALAIKPTLADAHFELARTYEQLHRYRESEREYEEALRYVPDYPGAAAGLARIGQAGGIDE